MTRQLSAATTLDNLKKEAKRWLKDLRANNPEARARLLRAFPKAPAEPVLRDVQHAIAVEFGFSGWTALKGALENRSATSSASDSHAQLITRFFDYACPDHHVRGGPAHVIARHAALRLLRQHPEIALANLYTAIVCGEIEEVER